MKRSFKNTPLEFKKGKIGKIQGGILKQTLEDTLGFKQIQTSQVLEAKKSNRTCNTSQWREDPMYLKTQEIMKNYSSFWGSLTSFNYLLLFLYCSLLYNTYIFCMHGCVCIIRSLFCAQLGLSLAQYSCGEPTLVHQTISIRPRILISTLAWVLCKKKEPILLCYDFFSFSNGSYEVIFKMTNLTTKLVIVLGCLRL